MENLASKFDYMKEYKENSKTNEVNEPQSQYRGFVNISEDEKLLANMNRPDIEKLQSFTKMLRRSKTLKTFKILDSDNK